MKVAARRAVRLRECPLAVLPLLHKVNSPFGKFSSLHLFLSCSISF